MRFGNFYWKKIKIKGFCFLLLVLGFFSIFTYKSCFAVKSIGGIPILKGKFKKYVAKAGDNLYTIAKKFDLAIEHVMFANGMHGIKTKVGQVLIIPTRRIPPPVKMTDGLVLNLPERGIYLYKNGEIVKFYPVAIGKPGKWMTPVGDMKIINKTKNPIWFPPEWAKEEKPVPAGPQNPLGDRWMGLNRPGYGIHATNNPMSIGMATSHGCIRMYPELAHDLYERVYVNMPVKIIYEPVKLGYDPEEKRIYMEVYPDVYHKTSGLLNVAKQKLMEYNLLGLVDEKVLKRIVNRKRGIPEPILGTDIVIKVNDKKVPLSFSPISHNGRIWVTSEILKPLGAVLLWDNDRKEVTIYRRKKKVVLKVKKVDDTDQGSSKDIAYLWQGRTIIPLSYVLKKLGVVYWWLPKERTMLIYSGIGTNGEVEKNVPYPEEVPDDIPEDEVHP